MQLQAHWQLANLGRAVVIPGPCEAPGSVSGSGPSHQQPRFRGDKPKRAVASSPEAPAALDRVLDPGPYRLPTGELLNRLHSVPHMLDFQGTDWIEALTTLMMRLMTRSESFPLLSRPLLPGSAIS